MHSVLVEGSVPHGSHAGRRKSVVGAGTLARMTIHAWPRVSTRDTKWWSLEAAPVAKPPFSSAPPGLGELPRETHRCHRDCCFPDSLPNPRSYPRRVAASWAAESASRGDDRFRVVRAPETRYSSASRWRLTLVQNVFASVNEMRKHFVSRLHSHHDMIHLNRKSHIIAVCR